MQIHRARACFFAVAALLLFALQAVENNTLSPGYWSIGYGLVGMLLAIIAFVLAFAYAYSVAIEWRDRNVTRSTRRGHLD